MEERKDLLGETPVSKTPGGEPIYQAEPIDETPLNELDPEDRVDVEREQEAHLNRLAQEVGIKPTVGPKLGGVQMAHNAKGAPGAYDENGQLKVVMAASSRRVKPAKKLAQHKLTRTTPTGLPMYDRDEFDQFADTGWKRRK